MVGTKPPLPGRARGRHPRCDSCAPDARRVVGILPPDASTRVRQYIARCQPTVFARMPLLCERGVECSERPRRVGLLARAIGAHRLPSPVGRWRAPAMRCVFSADPVKDRPRAVRNACRVQHRVECAVELCSESWVVSQRFFPFRRHSNVLPSNELPFIDQPRSMASCINAHDKHQFRECRLKSLTAVSGQL